MKKFIAGFLSCLLLTAGMTVIAAEYKIIPNPYPIFVDGQAKDISAYNIDGRTYIKMSEVGMATGSLVEFNTELQRIEITTPTTVSGQNKNAEVDTVLKDTITATRFRALVELLGHKYPDMVDVILLDRYGKLTFGEKTFELPINPDGKTVDASILSEEGILSASDF
jgi:hypothetical protein